ncbi:choice-of-anchor H family protein [Aliiglaciecola sp. LCG003]|uniref:choice-of-anchor H family protein n=1 Tax=Aliiglaciecola sp. LCG003 TaxID=3053655 RepID=UPI002572BDF7|nr:choice-of-anchor H family protein [Aliiglaciecola sp. LCG003]WJG10075.1 choice-of-anchor H family protein [Aliiglaciecola sp. LCG003]
MPRITFFGLFFVLSAQLSFSALATDVADNTSISVASTESQHGKQLAVIHKKGSPVQARTVLKKQALAKQAGKSENHQAKQLASPLSKPFARDLRIAEDNSDFWIYDAFVSLDYDRDYDGYYSRFTVEFDADTIYTQAEVYARLYLARGEVFEEYHTTSLFLINGDSSTDSFVVESELISGFPTDDYEVLIELYDGYSDELLVTFDGYNDVDLTLLPLESSGYEQVDTVVVVTESGGSFGFLTLLLVPLLMRRMFCTKH